MKIRMFSRCLLDPTKSILVVSEKNSHKIRIYYWTQGSWGWWKTFILVGFLLRWRNSRTGLTLIYRVGIMWRPFWKGWRTVIYRTPMPRCRGHYIRSGTFYITSISILSHTFYIPKGLAVVIYFHSCLWLQSHKWQTGRLPVDHLSRRLWLSWTKIWCPHRTGPSLWWWQVTWWKFAQLKRSLYTRSLIMEKW